MKRAASALVVVILLLVSAPAAGQAPPPWPVETADQKAARLQWWTDARFGMFIHWGLYALPARHEWVKKYERASDTEYRTYFEQFNPDLYDPREWARQAKQAGMKYAVITAKHHEGFSLFDSKVSDYTAMTSPARRDLIREWVDAFRAEGLRVGFYYSLLDWHHPSYTVDRNHPQSAATDADYATLNRGRDMGVYRRFIKDQVRELLTNYGRIDILWLDYSFPTGTHGKGRHDWDSVGVLKMVRDLQPHVIVNDRLDLLDVPGGWDFRSPEQFKPRAWVTMDGQRVPWETCQTFSGSWGYFRDEASWKSPAQLIELLIDTVSKGGNLLMNVGPTARGTFDQRAQDRLAAFGRWTQLNGRSIYGATQAPDDFKAPHNTLLTFNPRTRRLYVHLLAWPMGDLVLDGYAGRVAYAQLLHDASEVRMSAGRTTTWLQEQGRAGDLVLKLPMLKPDIEIPVVELVLR